MTCRMRLVPPRFSMLIYSRTSFVSSRFCIFYPTRLGTISLPYFVCVTFLSVCSDILDSSLYSTLLCIVLEPAENWKYPLSFTMASYSDCRPTCKLAIGCHLRHTNLVNRPVDFWNSSIMPHDQSYPQVLNHLPKILQNYSAIYNVPSDQSGFKLFSTSRNGLSSGFGSNVAIYKLEAWSCTLGSVFYHHR